MRGARRELVLRGRIVDDDGDPLGDALIVARPFGELGPDWGEEHVFAEHGPGWQETITPLSTLPAARSGDDGRFEVRVPWLLADTLHRVPEAAPLFAGEGDPRCPLGSWEELYPWLLVQRGGFVPIEVLDIRTAWETNVRVPDDGQLIVDLGRELSHLADSTRTDRQGIFELDVPPNDVLWLEHTTQADLRRPTWPQPRPFRLHLFSAPTPGTHLDLGSLSPTQEQHRAPRDSLLPSERNCWVLAPN